MRSLAGKLCHQTALQFKALNSALNSLWSASGDPMRRSTEAKYDVFCTLCFSVINCITVAVLLNVRRRYVRKFHLLACLLIYCGARRRVQNHVTMNVCTPTRILWYYLICGIACMCVWGTRSVGTLNINIMPCVFIVGILDGRPAVCLSSGWRRKPTMNARFRFTDCMTLIYEDMQIEASM